MSVQSVDFQGSIIPNLVDLSIGSSVPYVARSSVDIFDKFASQSTVIRRSGFAIFTVIAGRPYRFDVNHTNTNIGFNSQQFGNVQARVRMVSGVSSTSSISG